MHLTDEKNIYPCSVRVLPMVGDTGFKPTTLLYRAVSSPRASNLLYSRLTFSCHRLQSPPDFSDSLATVFKAGRLKKNSNICSLPFRFCIYMQFLYALTVRHSTQKSPRRCYRTYHASWRLHRKFFAPTFCALTCIKRDRNSTFH